MIGRRPGVSGRPIPLTHSVPKDWFSGYWGRNAAQHRSCVCCDPVTVRNDSGDTVCISCGACTGQEYRLPDAWCETSTIIHLHTYKYLNYLGNLLRPLYGKVQQKDLEFVTSTFPRFYEAFFKINPKRKGFTSYPYTVRRLLIFAGVDVALLSSIRDPVTPRIVAALDKSWPRMCELAGINMTVSGHRFYKPPVSSLLSNSLVPLGRRRKPFKTLKRTLPSNLTMPASPKYNLVKFAECVPPANPPRKVSGNYAVVPSNQIYIPFADRPGIIVQTDYNAKVKEEQKKLREDYVADPNSDKKLLGLCRVDVSEESVEKFCKEWEKYAAAYIKDNLQLPRGKKLLFSRPFADDEDEGGYKLKMKIPRDVAEECAVSQGKTAQEIFDLTYGTYKCVFAVEGVWHNANNFGIKLAAMKLALGKEGQAPSKRLRPSDIEFPSDSE